MAIEWAIGQNVAENFCIILCAKIQTTRKKAWQLSHFQRRTEFEINFSTQQVEAHFLAYKQI
jgi:hypothetical protein